MNVTQLTVFLENKRGALSKVTGLIARSGIDLIALSIGETEQYGMLRLIVSDTAACAQAMKAGGYTVRETNVLVVAVPDRPGGLSYALEILSERGLDVEYLYSFVRGSDGNALVVLYLDDIAAGRALLAEKGVKMLGEDEIRAL